MKESEFDKCADEYLAMHRANVRLSGESPEFFSAYKVRDVRALVGEGFPGQGSILDFGAGVGGSLPFFRECFPGAQVTCLDVSARSLAIARERFGDMAEFRHHDGGALPFAPGTFDLVFAACVFHHIPEASHVAILAEWHRILRPGGFAVVFEHNPWNPLTVHAVNTCPFDENAKLIAAPEMKRRLAEAGFDDVRLRYRLFVPGLLRSLRPVERLLHWCPAGAQYLTYARKVTHR